MKNLLLASSILISPLIGLSQSINLSNELERNEISVLNRQVSGYERDGIELDAAEGDGLAVLNHLDFRTGTIQLEIKGENAPGRSFVGLAFNIENDSTYEAVYFRPFNFVAEDPIRRSHMLQYIFHPAYPWYTLREERTEEFEAELSAPPKPDKWFKAKIEITAQSVTVFVDEQEKPALKIERLNEHKSSAIGLWVGNGSSGRFRNLEIRKEP